MRYIINDDDVEDWCRRLVTINTIIKNVEIEYIIEQMQNEISSNLESIKIQMEKLHEKT